MIKNILIVGGGTAGWLTALTMRKHFPQFNIELIESEEIGVLGAGESTTSSFAVLLKELGIDFKEFIKETDSTIKAGVRFDDWNSPTSSYFSPFMPWFAEKHITNAEMPDYFIYCYVNNIDANSIGINKLYLNDRVPIIKTTDNLVEQIAGYTYHINARLTSKYFRKIAESRGIVRHEGKVIKINGRYPITSLEDDKGRVHKVDFVFDCSGFARLIIGKHYGTEWENYTKNLTVNSTIPFFLPVGEKIIPYTHTTAMKYGWMFKVPTKNRYGSGYIYDSNLISKEQAIKEVHEKLGHEVELINHFNFNSGVYKKTLVSNCISLGLSSGFLEPMAATSLGSVCFLLHIISRIKSFDALVYNELSIDYYNNKAKSMMEYPYMTEIFCNYVNDREDTEFWRHYKNKDNWPIVFRKVYDDNFSGDKFDFRSFSASTGFDSTTLMSKILGNEWFREKVMKYYLQNDLEKKYKIRHKNLMRYIDILTPKIFDHKEYLESASAD